MFAVFFQHINYINMWKPKTEVIYQVDFAFEDIKKIKKNFFNLYKIINIIYSNNFR